MLELINENGTDIDFSTVTGSFQSIEDKRTSYTKLLSAETNGVNIANYDHDTVVSDCLHHIYGDAMPNVGVYKAILATGYTDVVLDKPLTKHDMELAEKLYNDPEYVFSADELADCADTDEDRLRDFAEVMFFTHKGWWIFESTKSLVTIKENGDIKLPNVKTITGSLDELGYSYVGYEKARAQYGNCLDEFLQMDVLPIKSDPTNTDGDGDGYDDSIDRRKLKWDISSAKIKDDKYVSYSGDKKNYGGYQGWFSAVLGNVIGGYLTIVGCGIVASCDLIHYIKFHHDKPQLSELDEHAATSEYSMFALDYMLQYILGEPSIPGWTLSEIWLRKSIIGGVWRSDICRALNRYFEDNGCSEYTFTFKSTISFKTREQFAMSIYEMLENDTPVIARIGYGDGLIPIINNDYTGKSFNDVNWHYIMITEIYYDVINDKYALTCSSWGEKYRIDLDDFYHNSGWTGGIVDVK